MDIGVFCAVDYILLLNDIGFSRETIRGVYNRAMKKEVRSEA